MKIPSVRSILIFIAGFAACCLLITASVFGACYFWLTPYISKNPKFKLHAPPIPSLEKVELNLQFKDADNKEYNLKDFLGKTIILNFWATWCPPCVRELPSLARLSAKYRNNPNVVVICLSDESIQEILPKAYVEEMKTPIFSTEGYSVPRFYDKGSIPATFIISAEGRIALTHVGAAKWDDDSVIAFIDRLAQQ